LNSSNNISWYSFGISYRNALAVDRQNYALNDDDVKLFYSKIFPEYECSGFIVNTCNRITFFLHGVHPNKIEKKFLESISSSKDIFKVGYRYVGFKAINHLFELGAGMDSQILGDFEIIGQLRRAFQFSKSHGATNGLLERALNSAVHFSRRVKSETGFSSGTSSTSYAAIKFLQVSLPNFTEAKILILGTGEIGDRTLDNLIASRGRLNITLANRTDETAKNIASEKGVEYFKWSNWKSNVENFDAIICTSRAPNYLLSLKDLKEKHPKVFVDLSMPMCLDPTIGNIDGVTLVNIDDISSFIGEQLSSRQGSLPKVQEILDEEIEKFRQSHRAKQAVPIIKRVQKDLEKKWTEADKDPEKIERLSSKIESRLFESVRRCHMRVHTFKKWISD